MGSFIREREREKSGSFGREMINVMMVMHEVVNKRRFLDAEGAEHLEVEGIEPRDHGAFSQVCVCVCVCRHVRERERERERERDVFCRGGSSSNTYHITASAIINICMFGYRPRDHQHRLRVRACECRSAYVCMRSSSSIGPSNNHYFDHSATIVMPSATVIVCCVSVSMPAAHRTLGMGSLISKTGHGIFNARNVLNACCSHEGETDTVDESAQVWTQKN